MNPRRVTIIQERLPDYRILFFQKLRNRLKQHQIELELLYSPDISDDLAMSELSWATSIHSRRVRSLTWQPVLRRCWYSDLVIVPQLTRYPASILLQFLRGLTARKHAFWGHGSNSKPSSVLRLAEALKRTISVRADWWFAYNDLAARVVAGLGYPENRITSVMNAIDTSGIRQRREQLSAAEIEAARRELGIMSRNVAIFTGSLRDFKRPEFLVAACEKIREQVPDFEMIVIGDGEYAEIMVDAVARWSWFHYLGRKNDMDKVPYWALSKLSLMPGGVGLVALDSLALGVPMVTTANRFHGPEIDYLKDGINGVMVQAGDDPACYAAEVVALLRDDERCAAMAANALADCDLYSCEDMCQRFTDGILSVLAAPRYRLCL